MDHARACLLASLGRRDLDGLSFLDLGCGSGLHSLAAVRSGARSVLSLDLDPESVAATAWLRQREGDPPHWRVQQGSILDEALVAALEPHDVVYSWGVLHHTGAVWRALANASRPLAGDGLFLVALYTTDGYARPDFALAQKRRYNAAGPLGRRRMELGYVWWTLLRPNLLRPWRAVRAVASYRSRRGMDYLTDVRDWLGGWPMEFCGVAETRRFVGDELGLELLACYGHGIITEYLGCRRGATTSWHRVAPAAGPSRLERPFAAVGGCAWSAPLPDWLAVDPPRDEAALHQLELREDGLLLGPSGASPEQIGRAGAGAFTVADGRLLLSASDGGDPNRSERCYTLLRRPSPGAAGGR